MPGPRALAHALDAATPPDRDRALDALRAVAILGVVLGHWLVTALVAGDGGTLSGASPLQHMPWLAPVSWMFQTLALFFFVGGVCGARSLASARARGTACMNWLGGRLGRLGRPVLAVLAVWAAACGIALACGASPGALRTLVSLVVSPLWFLLVFAALTAATPLVARMHPLVPLAVVAAVDATRFGLGGPSWPGWINVAAGWLVPYTLGTACARGRFASGRSGVPLLVGGVLATAALVVFGGYPASMVGVPGAAISNLNPPTLAAVTFGLAQCGLALMLREPLRRAMRRPLPWAAVALTNLSAMTIFLWHQTAMMAVTTATLAAGPLPGLHTTPDGPGWVAVRLLWLPVFALALAVLRQVFGRFERPRARHSARKARTWRETVGSERKSLWRRQPVAVLTAPASRVLSTGSICSSHDDHHVAYSAGPGVSAPSLRRVRT
ncbi:acyltransferase [Streptomyces sp. AV19]|uniref:acyltransferase family protein n=1 Tax=Streptomyces sp. AV19 TaxID=2793068 RepID=UPI001F337083|nr:acyltransferase [Streptomyces sp. AV19]MDG4533904.1 acyltransferase [Streptomyces sp. AV19]